MSKSRDNICICDYSLERNDVYCVRSFFVKKISQ